MIIGAHCFEQMLTDRCYVDERTAGDEWGSTRTEVEYTESEDIVRCRVIAHRDEEVPGDSKARISNASIYLPADTCPSEATRIRVTKRDGVTLGTPDIFSVINVQKKGYGTLAECIEAKGNSLK
jgi:hypothetical protein